MGTKCNEMPERCQLAFHAALSWLCSWGRGDHRLSELPFGVPGGDKLGL